MSGSGEKKGEEARRREPVEIEEQGEMGAEHRVETFAGERASPGKGGIEVRKPGQVDVAMPEQGMDPSIESEARRGILGRPIFLLKADKVEVKDAINHEISHRLARERKPREETGSQR
ncbi:hypothetical protein [Aeropyrum camini]|uniref:ABC-type sugar transporter n=1 Tax=Aeropyrum camini SY1 = JCM 12091 TaxID=1198449 RepID=U3TE79_9CREN|nr:hypothetical protein [Aeropyrum camini]BAN90741.1 ABC-type sugar transporter [Aeropyrum camini SY1 = JCM 12091]